MKITSSFIRASFSIFIAVTVFGVVSLGPESSPTQGNPAALAPILLQALPSLATVVGNLFKPKTKDSQSSQQSAAIGKMTADSQSGGKQLETYVKRTEILSNMVGGTGKASANVAVMIQDIGGKTTLEQSDVDDMNNNEWPGVLAALQAIRDAKPDPKAFENDTTATIAIKNIIDQGLPNTISKQLGYSPEKSDPDLGQKLQANPDLVRKLLANLVELESRFLLIGQVASAELQFVSDGLANISATAQVKPANIQQKAADIKNEAFTGEDAALKRNRQTYIEDLGVAVEKMSRPIA